MKRDLDLVRRILLETEQRQDRLTLQEILAFEPDSKKAAFHVELMCARGLIDAKVSRAYGGDPVQIDIHSLTWEGYDYLDTIRSEQVWQRSKKAISEAVGDTSLSVVKEVCSALAVSLVKSSLGI